MEEEEEHEEEEEEEEVLKPQNVATMSRRKTSGRLRS